jgi:NAD(P)-dependent dehydrogenase (short-subunit alcohol dehydrogenase family)
VLDVNASGTFIVSQVCARRMRDANNPGSIVNLASKSSFQPTKGFAHYAASKGAVAMITKALAMELAPYSIRVNAVAPGSVATNAVGRSGAQLDPDLMSEVAARTARCPMGRAASADEMARVVLFLASNWSTYMTGSIVLADGGFLVS